MILLSNLLKSKLLKFKNKPVKTTYDTYNNEILQIITPNIFSGLRTEISKTISSFCQISNIKTDSTNQTFLTFSSKNSVFQFSFDNDRNYQLKSSLLTGQIVSKVHAIISRKKEIFSQFETILSSKFYNIAFKLISPTFEASNLVYIITYFASLKFFSFGFEAVGINNEVGLSFATRLENKESICCVNIQRFNIITLSLYHRILKILELGVEIKKSKDNFSYSGGMRIKNYKSEVKCCLDSNFNIFFDWSENLTENLKIDFSSSYDWEELEYGIGLTFEC